jgi:Tfp pilus assembly protein PilF
MGCGFKRLRRPSDRFWPNLRRSSAPDLAAEARHAAERAQALGPDRPEGPLALGAYYVGVAVDNQQALAAFQAGLKLAPTNAVLLVDAALAEQHLGRWDAALQHLAKASALDPRSANTARRTGVALLSLRSYPEAQAALDRGLALAPSNLSIIERKAMVALAQGDLAGTQAVVRAALTTVEPAALLAVFGNYQDLYWVLDDAQQQQLLTLPATAWDNDRSTWAIVRAQTYALRGNQALARTYADSARLTRRSSSGPRPTMASGMFSGGSRSPTLARRPRRSARGSARSHPCPSAGTPTAAPTSSTSWCGSICSWASPRRHSTSSSRYSRSPTTSRPVGFGSTPRSRRSRATHGSRNSSPAAEPADAGSCRRQVAVGAGTMLVMIKDQRSARDYRPT